jgi:hypothetical protein
MVARYILIGVFVILILIAGSLLGWWLAATFAPWELHSRIVFPIPPATHPQQ